MYTCMDTKFPLQKLQALRISLEKKIQFHVFVYFQDRMLLSLADLITMATFLSITPSIKDTFNSTSARGEKRGIVLLTY